MSNTYLTYLSATVSRPEVGHATVRTVQWPQTSSEPHKN